MRLVPQERVEAHAVLDRRKGLGIEHAAIVLNRVTHRFRVRDDVELREVHPFRREIELRPHCGPVGVAVDGGNGDRFVRRGSARGRAADQGQADSCNEITAVQRHGALSPEERSSIGGDTTLLRGLILCWQPMAKLILGLVAFFGVHSISLLALGWRNRVAQRLGTRAWQGIYSIASLLGFYLLISGYRATRATAAVLYVPPAWLPLHCGAPDAACIYARARLGAAGAHQGPRATSTGAGDHALGPGASLDQWQRDRRASVRHFSRVVRRGAHCRSIVVRPARRIAFSRARQRTMRLP